jgi:hypothetical protein
MGDAAQVLSLLGEPTAPPTWPPPSAAAVAAALKCAMLRLHPDKQPAGTDPRSRAWAEEAFKVLVELRGRVR